MSLPGPTLAEAARRLKRPRAAAWLPRLILLTDSVRLPEPDRAVRRLPRGSAVVLREPDPHRRARLARRLMPLCRSLRLRLLVAGDPRLAARIGAGGLHLPERLLRHGPRCGRAGRRPGWLITAAVHSPHAIRIAALAGADAVLLSPVFPTRSHPGAPALGICRFARWVHASPLPVYALGGIDGRTARRLRGLRLAGFAAIGALAGDARELR